MHVKWIPILAVLLGAQVALALAMDLRSDRLAPAKPDTPLVVADLGPVDRISIDGPVTPEPAAADATATERLELIKREGRWIMPEHHGAPADADKVEHLLMRTRSSTC